MPKVESTFILILWDGDESEEAQAEARASEVNITLFRNKNMGFSADKQTVDKAAHAFTEIRGKGICPVALAFIDDLQTLNTAITECNKADVPLILIERPVPGRRRSLIKGLIRTSDGDDEFYQAAFDAA